MSECKICGGYFASSCKEELCITCKRALDRLGDYVAPVKHGKWIDSPDGTTTICSYCKADWNVFDNDTYRFSYCPNCGAKMDLED